MMMEIIFGAVAFAGLVAFIIFLFRLSGSSTPKRKTRKRKQKLVKKPAKTEDDEIPKEWREENPGHGTSVSAPSLGIPKKIRVPGLRTSKRILAFVMLLLNFFISQATLMSSPATQPMFWLFFFNSLILLDYLWKTRRRETA